MNSKNDFLISIDPGLNVAGWAVWFLRSSWEEAIDAPELWKAGHTRNPVDSRGPKAWFAMVTRLKGNIRSETGLTFGNLNFEFALEWLEVYKGKTGYSADVLELAGVVGTLNGQFPEADFETYKPRTWTRGRPKKANQPRILRRLSEQEIASAFHPTSTDEIRGKVENGKQGVLEHAIDAIGVGLYHLEKL